MADLCHMALAYVQGLAQNNTHARSWKTKIRGKEISAAHILQMLYLGYGPLSSTRKLNESRYIPYLSATHRQETTRIWKDGGKGEKGMRLVDEYSTFELLISPPSPFFGATQPVPETKHF